MELKLDRRFKKKAQGMVEKYRFEVGILKDAPHKMAQSKKKGLKTFAGGSARKVKAKSTISVARVSAYVRKLRKINYITRPFETKYGKSADLVKFTNQFFRVIFRKGQERQLINTLQAIVRNPILRGDYGKNKARTARVKGFNRFMIDTAQLFKSITAKVSKRV